MRLNRINPFKRKSTSERIVASLEGALAKPLGTKVKLPSPPSGKALRAGGLTLAGLMGLTAGSAGISSLRRRAEGPKGAT